MKTCSKRVAKINRAKKRSFDKGFREIYQMKPNVSKIKDPELKAKWVAALRSGEYQQVRGMLKGISGDTPAFCCLGVLCDVLKPDGWSGTDVYGAYEHSFNDGKSVQDTYPNRSVMKDLGIYPSAAKDLAKMNDDDHADFNKIADYIEKTL